MGAVTDLTTAKLNLKHMKEHTMNEHDLESLAEKLAAHMKANQTPHLCQFSPETIEALKSLAGFYSETQKSFKRFLVFLIVFGALVLLVVGLGKHIKNFCSAL